MLIDATNALKPVTELAPNVEFMGRNGLPAIIAEAMRWSTALSFQPFSTFGH